MTSIKDVARAAGTSTSTVSRVLGHPESVRSELRERVQQAIAQLGYRPNLAARRLRQQRASVIGLIVADIRNPFFTDISRAVEDVAYAHGLRLILCNSDEDPAKERAYLELMADEKASGVILAPTATFLKQAESNPDAAADNTLPLVLVDRAPARSPWDSVVLDNTAAARAVTQHLVDQGFERIALLAGAHSTTGQERRTGYEQVMREHGRQPLVQALPPTVEAGGQAAAQWLSGSHSAERPDAILATNGLLLLGAQQALIAAGLNVPEDVALAGFDNNDWTALQCPAVTVVSQPTYEIGHGAAELLLQRMQPLKNGSQRSARRVVLQGDLLERGSTQRLSVEA